MNKFFRLCAAALLMFTAAACHIGEIDKPDNPNGPKDPNNPDKPQDSELVISASIIQTRVTYGDNGDKLDQWFEVGDEVFGYIGKNTGKKVSLTVSKLTDEGRAILSPKDADDKTALSALAEGDVVDLVYTMSATSYEGDAIVVNMTEQRSDRIPACMHARASVEESGGTKYLYFQFKNDCAILEIYKLAGIAHSDTFVGTSQTLNSITVSNLYNKGQYTFNEDYELEFSPLDDASTVGITMGLGSGWTITKSTGKISGPEGAERVLVAAIPIETEGPLEIKAVTLEYSDGFVFNYGRKNLEGGICYVIQNDVVARVGNEYFTTVTAAFEQAREEYVPNSEDIPEVVLLRDCGLGGVLPNGVPIVGACSPIEIDGYDVTLDLNGHTLTLENECFRVNFDEDDDWTLRINNFTIIDSSEGDGEITSLGETIIYSFGEVNIKGGTIHSNDCYVVENYGTLKVMGGEISSEKAWAINNDEGNVSISGGEIYSYGDNCEAVSGGDVSVTGGKIKSKFLSAISTEGNIEISGNCIIESEKWVAISAISDADLTMSGGKVFGASGGIQLTDGSTGTITGGTIGTIESIEQGEDENIYALYVENSTCTISGGTFKNSSKTKPAIFCFTDENNVVDLDEGSPNLLITWPGGVESADGPLIVSSAKGTNFGAVSTANSKENGNEETNYAIVEISGGYLISSDSFFCSKGGNSSVWFTGSFYTNSGNLYYDFSKDDRVAVSCTATSGQCGGYNYNYEIQPTWTYVIDKCSQTKTKIGANEAVTYYFRSYKQMGTEKKPVPWIAEMYVDGNAGYGWQGNHNYGPNEDGWCWTTNRDNETGQADKGDGSIDTNEDYIITFKSTKSDTYTVRIIASDDDGSITYTFAPVVQTL